MEFFLSWFYEFLSTMLDGIWMILSGIGGGLLKTFNVVVYFQMLAAHGQNFSFLEWILAIISLIIVIAIWLLVIALIVLVIRKYIRFRRSIVGSEDLLEEVARLHRQVLVLTKEKEKILALKIGQTSISVDAINEIFSASEDKDTYIKTGELPGEGTAASSEGGTGVTTTDTSQKRFFRLAAVDDKYEYYVEPPYKLDITLPQICETFRNFACSSMHLYYELKTIRLMFAGMASTKMILLQGISGTGKTSLPYAMGKFFKNDATIASVQPSWRDRTELFGYFNEFTKKFNETEVLKRIYESSYNDDINIIVLDEMNIARVEYYFAEMLSVLEMPDVREWKLDIVPSAWSTDPKHFVDGKLLIPQNVWYVGTANNDDSTFSVSDKVYDRALTINLDSKGIAFDAPPTDSEYISYSHVNKLYLNAIEQFPVSAEYLDCISRLDIYVIQKFRIAFGNRIMKQLSIFVPVYVACGGKEIDGIDYILATKVFRKFEGLNLALIRDEVKGLINFLDRLFGKGVMAESIAYLDRLQKMF